MDDAKKAAEDLSKSAQENLDRVGVEIASGWGQFNKFLDTMLDTPDTTKDIGEEGLDDAQEAFRLGFPEVAADEEVVDAFSCELLQKYRCFHNNATPERSFSIRGRLFVTVNLAAFLSLDSSFSSSPFTITAKFCDIEKVQKSQSTMLRLLIKGHSYYIFTGFKDENDFSGAVNLLEHMWESAKSDEPSVRLDTSEGRDSNGPGA